MGRISALAAGEQALRRLRLKNELHSASQSEVLITHTDKKEKDNRKGCLVWRYSLRAKILSLSAWQTSLPISERSMRPPSCIRTNGFELNTPSAKRKEQGMPKGIPCSFGRSVEIRTPGLQYPKLARYQLRYTSILRSSNLPIYYSTVFLRCQYGFFFSHNPFET